MDLLIRQTVQKATIKIIGERIQGSGVIIEIVPGDYLVVTARHVIDNEDQSAKFILTNNDDYMATVYKHHFAMSDFADLAATRFRTQGNVTAFKIESTSISNYNDKVWVAGYSGASYQDTLRISPGCIMAISKFAEKDGYELIYSNPTTRGMSGGAIVNRKGYLIGIHAAGEIDSLLGNNDASIVYTGANIGIPSTYLNTFCGSINSVCSPVNVDMKSGDESIVNPQGKIPNSLSSQDKDGATVKSNGVIDHNIDGNLMHSKGDYNGAIHEYTFAINISNSREELTILYFCRANSWDDLGNFNQAFCDFTQSLSCDPNNYKSLVNRGNLLLFKFNAAERALLDAKQARQVVERMQVCQKQYGPVFVLEGNALAALSDPVAFDSYTKAIKYDSLSHDAFWGRGRLKVINGIRDKATALDIRTACELGNASAKEYAKSASGAWLMKYN